MKAIKATRQVTKAMELVAASKRRRAVQNAQQLRKYANASWEILQSVSALNPDLHISLGERPASNILVLVFSSDRGLAGNLNASLFKAAAKYIKEVKQLPTFKQLDFVAIGRKAQQFLSRSGQNVVAAFPAMSNNPTFKDIRPMVKLANDQFTNRTYDHVVLIYTDFISTLVQEPRVKVLLPFSNSVLKEMLASILPQKQGRAEDKKPTKAKLQYTFEPSAEEVVQSIIPLITEVQVYQALLEAVASEHSARMVAMRSASDNATSLLDDLTLTYNQTRQAAITGELAELSASKAVVEQA